MERRVEPITIPNIEGINDPRLNFDNPRQEIALRNYNTIFKGILSYLSIYYSYEISI